MILLINKPRGITSHDVINKLRIITGIKKIGHAGTLDPNATGLLIIGIGRNSTKILSRFLFSDKIYKADIVLGEERSTDDAEGEKRKRDTLNYSPKPNFVPSLKALNIVLNQFVGENLQTPPQYSAKKIKGKRAYKLARKGDRVLLSPKKINIKNITLLSYNYPSVKVITEVSSGTYIRALARDIGRKLGTGAYLKNLKRTKIGIYDLKNAHKLDLVTSKNWKKLALA